MGGQEGLPLDEEQPLQGRQIGIAQERLPLQAAGGEEEIAVVRRRRQCRLAGAQGAGTLGKVRHRHAARSKPAQEAIQIAEHPADRVVAEQVQAEGRQAVAADLEILLGPSAAAAARYRKARRAVRPGHLLRRRPRAGHGQARWRRRFGAQVQDEAMAFCGACFADGKRGAEEDHRAALRRGMPAAHPDAHPHPALLPAGEPGQGQHQFDGAAVAVEGTAHRFAAAGFDGVAVPAEAAELQRSTGKHRHRTAALAIAGRDHGQVGTEQGIGLDGQAELVSDDAGPHRGLQQRPGGELVGPGDAPDAPRSPHPAGLIQAPVQGRCSGQFRQGDDVIAGVPGVVFDSAVVGDQPRTEVGMTGHFQPGMLFTQEGVAQVVAQRIQDPVDLGQWSHFVGRDRRRAAEDLDLVQAWQVAAGRAIDGQAQPAHLYRLHLDIQPRADRRPRPVAVQHRPGRVGRIGSIALGAQHAERPHGAVLVTPSLVVAEGDVADPVGLPEVDLRPGGQSAADPTVVIARLAVVQVLRAVDGEALDAG